MVCPACTIAETENSTTTLVKTEEFKQYWFAGKAELVRFALEQARYGEIHRGDAVLIFVTEDFLPDKQVKSDSADRARSGALPVLKLNFTRKFNTGLYPYSMMTSVFAPLDLDSRAHALKTSTTVQEWCGHTYLQLNLRRGAYGVQSRSYFESEADQDYELPEAWLEDEIWTRIRLAPESLPVGELQIIPGAQQSRLLHRPMEVEQATAKLETGDGERTYVLEYPSSGRRLAIRFAAVFPHEILGWEETRGSGPEALTTRAVRTHTLLTDYWSRNRSADAPLRGELGLD
jgi:hypothetical protein